MGQWYHYVVTYDGSTSTLYVNGSNIFSATSPNAPDAWSPLGIGAGKWNYGAIGGIRWLQGSEDEVAVYTNLLPASRIAAHYAAGTSAGSNYAQTVLADNPLLYYRMDNPVYTNPGSVLCPAAINFGAVPVNGVYPPGTVPGGVSGPPIRRLGNEQRGLPHQRRRSRVWMRVAIRRSIRRGRSRSRRCSGSSPILPMAGCRR